MHDGLAEVFSGIKPTSFRGRGELSKDGGANWRLRSEFLARRGEPA